MFAGLMLSAAIAAHVPAKSDQCPTRPGDKAAIEQTVKSFYAALAKDDWAAFDKQVTGDFVAFEVGEQFSAKRLFDDIADAHRKGRVINWAVGPVIIRIDCKSAWAAWENVGSAGVPPAMSPRRWMESAVLRRSPTGWRIEFFHSSPAKPR